MGAVNLPVDWSIPDPLRKAPLAGGWKRRKKKIDNGYVLWQQYTGPQNKGPATEH